MAVNLIIIGPIAGEVYGCLQCKHTWPVTQDERRCHRCKSIICPNCLACHCDSTVERRVQAWGRDALNTDTGDMQL